MRMVRLLTAATAVFFLFFGFVSSGWAEERKPEEIRIVASFYPMYIMTRNVVKDVPGVTVSSLAPSMTGCLHDYALTTADMKSLAGANVFVGNGAGMEAFLERIAAQYPHIRFVR